MRKAHFNYQFGIVFGFGFVWTLVVMSCATWQKQRVYDAPELGEDHATNSSQSPGQVDEVGLMTAKSPNSKSSHSINTKASQSSSKEFWAITKMRSYLSRGITQEQLEKHMEMENKVKEKKAKDRRENRTHPLQPEHYFPVLNLFFDLLVHTTPTMDQTFRIMESFALMILGCC